jgi:hypothetical protein
VPPPVRGRWCGRFGTMVRTRRAVAAADDGDEKKEEDAVIFRLACNNPHTLPVREWGGEVVTIYGDKT